MARVVLDLLKPLASLSSLNGEERIKKQEAILEKKLWPPAAKQKAAVVALDGRGQSVSSREFAGLLDHLQQQYQTINFVIGSADGLSEDFLKKCHKRVSFGPLTFPHQFMPLLLVEQLFRADSIMRGTPYHLGH